MANPHDAATSRIKIGRKVYTQPATKAYFRIRPLPSGRIGSGPPAHWRGRAALTPKADATAMKAKAIATRHRGNVNRIWRAIKAWEQRFSGGFGAPFVFKRTDEPLPAARQPFHPAEWSSAKMADNNLPRP